MSVYLDKTPEQRERQIAQTRAARTRRRLEQPRAEMLGALKRSAKTLTNSRGRAVDFDLTEADLGWPTHCPVLGIKLNYPGEFTHDPAGASFDRLDISLGYVRGNVIVVSRRANALRKDGTPTELRAVADFYEFLG